METPFQPMISNFRELRDQNLKPLGKVLLRLKISPNFMTSLSFFFGLGAIYFLFSNYYYFLGFTLFHLLADALDGVLARLTKSTSFGKYFDSITDQIIAFLLIFKIYLYLNDVYILIVLGLFILTYTIYFLSQMNYPAIFVRTGTIITLMFFPLFPNLTTTGTYLVVGIFIIYSLLLQLKNFLTNQKTPKKD